MAAILLFFCNTSFFAYLLCCRPLRVSFVEWVCVWADGDGYARMEWLEDSDLHLKGILARYREGYYKTAHEMRLHVIRLWHNWSHVRGPFLVIPCLRALVYLVCQLFCLCICREVLAFVGDLSCTSCVI
jgi:hypothetical protein